MPVSSKFNIDDYDLFIFDIEGVLVNDIDSPKRYEDAFTLMNHLKNRNKKYVCLSNVGRKSHKYVLSTLLNLGYPVNQDIVYSAGKVASIYFKKYYPKARIFLISEGGVLQDFLEAGLIIADNPPIDFVVVSADRNLTYAKLNFAARMLLKGAKLVGVGGGFIIEGTYLGDKGVYLGEDAFVYMLSKATSVEALFIGKPHKIVYDVILSVYETSPEKTLMIGDKIETDVLGAKNAGLHSLLINRGRYSDTYIDKLPLNKKPDFIVKSFYEIMQK